MTNTVFQSVATDRIRARSPAPPRSPRRSAAALEAGGAEAAGRPLGGRACGFRRDRGRRSATPRLRPGGESSALVRRGSSARSCSASRRLLAIRQRNDRCSRYRAAAAWNAATWACSEARPAGVGVGLAAAAPALARIGQPATCDGLRTQEMDRVERRVAARRSAHAPGDAQHVGSHLEDRPALGTLRKHARTSVPAPAGERRPVAACIRAGSISNHGA